MKKFYFIVFVIIIAFAKTSCSKYEDGPLISLKSKQNRLLGVWKVVEFIKDNEDLTKFYQDTCGCDLEFAYDTSPDSPNSKWQHVNLLCDINNWNYFPPDEYLINTFYFTQGGWNLSKDRRFIWVNLGHDNDSRYRWGMYPLIICQFFWVPVEILRLTDNDLWVKYEDFENVYTIKFEKI